MAVVRLIIALLLAGFVTVGLFILMQTLIDTGTPEIKDEDRTKVADIVMPERQIETRVKERKPEKIDEAEPPPPDMPEPQAEDVEVSPQAISISAPKVSADMEIGIGGLSAADGEYLPIVKVQPSYPRRALSRGIEGYVIVEFTVTKTGTVRDPVVVEAKPSRIFDKAAKKAVLKWKYKPRVNDGVAVEVPGVRNKITFALEK